MADLTHLSLFTGIGGLDLAAEAAGFRTVGQCEWADYPTAGLLKEAEYRLSRVSYQLETGENLNNGLRNIKENEYDFLREVVFALRSQERTRQLKRFDLPEEKNDLEKG